MLRFIAAENTSRYSTGRPGRENALAVAEPPTKPISPGSVSAAKALTAKRRNHLPRNFSMNFITATNPPFITCHQKHCRRFRCVMKHAKGRQLWAQHRVATSRLANDSDSARTRADALRRVTSENRVTAVARRPGPARHD